MNRNRFLWTSALLSVASAASVLTLVAAGLVPLNGGLVGYPASSPIACDASEPGSEVTETVNAGGSSLSYNAASDQYSYIWKTNKAWKGTCRMLIVGFNDGSFHLAKFRFR